MYDKRTAWTFCFFVILLIMLFEKLGLVEIFIIVVGIYNAQSFLKKNHYRRPRYPTRKSLNGKSYSSQLSRTAFSVLRVNAINEDPA